MSIPPMYPHRDPGGHQEELRIYQADSFRFPSPCLLMQSVMTAVRTVLIKFQTIWIVILILGGDVVTVLAVSTGYRDLTPAVLLLCHASFLGLTRYIINVLGCQDTWAARGSNPEPSD